MTGVPPPLDRTWHRTLDKTSDRTGSIAPLGKGPGTRDQWAGVPSVTFPNPWDAGGKNYRKELRFWLLSDFGLRLGVVTCYYEHYWTFVIFHYPKHLFLKKGLVENTCDLSSRKMYKTITNAPSLMRSHAQLVFPARQASCSGVTLS